MTLLRLRMTRLLNKNTLPFLPKESFMYLQTRVRDRQKVMLFQLNSYR
jgi:hypothetical protein